MQINIFFAMLIVLGAILIALGRWAKNLPGTNQSPVANGIALGLLAGGGVFFAVGAGFLVKTIFWG